MTIYSGENDFNQMGQMTHLNGKLMLQYWSEDSCNAVGGSEGTFFPRDDVQRERPVYYFHKYFCRKLQCTLHSKINVYRYFLVHIVGILSFKF